MLCTLCRFKHAATHQRGSRNVEASLHTSSGVLSVSLCRARRRFESAENVQGHTRLVAAYKLAGSSTRSSSLKGCFSLRP